MEIRKVFSRSILSPSKLPGCDCLYQLGLILKKQSENTKFPSMGFILTDKAGYLKTFNLRAKNRAMIAKIIATIPKGLVISLLS